MIVMKKEKDKKKKREKQLSAPREEEKGTPELAAAAGTDRKKISGETETAESMKDLRCALEELGGKWRLQVLWSLRGGEGLRYSSIKGQISGITDMMLSQSLRELCRSGLVERQQFQEIPPRVEYRILQDGQELIPPDSVAGQLAEKPIRKRGNGIKRSAVLRDCVFS